MLCCSCSRGIQLVQSASQATTPIRAQLTSDIHTKMFNCTKCGKTYKKEGYLARHLVDKHADNSMENPDITLASEDDDTSRQLEDENTFMMTAAAANQDGTDHDGEMDLLEKEETILLENAVNENAVQFHGDIQDQSVFTQELLQPTLQGFDDILLGSNSVILGMAARLDEIQGDLDVSTNETLDDNPPSLVASTQANPSNRQLCGAPPTRIQELQNQLASSMEQSPASKQVQSQLEGLQMESLFRWT